MSNFRVFLIPIFLTFTFLLSSANCANAASIDDLILAVWGFETAEAAALIDGGVDVNATDSKGTYPLMLACSYKDNDEMIALLLEKGADPNIFGPNGETPLGLASKYSLKAVQMLVEKGADVNAKHEKGFTALWWAQKFEQPEIARFLKEKGAKE
jgi:ankyrin repeat protein